MPRTITFYGVFQRHETGSAHSTERTRAEAQAIADEMNHADELPLHMAITPVGWLLFLWRLIRGTTWVVREISMSVWSPEESARYERWALGEIPWEDVIGKPSVKD